MAKPHRATRGRASHRRGLAAELLCLWHLRLRGYRILAKRYRVPSGEIDLIARRGKVLAAIEVKVRADHARAAESLQARQRARIARAFEHFLKQWPEFGAASLRFDVMLVAPLAAPSHRRLAARRLNRL
jgi:putative endonuclease